MWTERGQVNYMKCKSRKITPPLLVQLVVVQEKLGYRHALKSGNNSGCHCLWATGRLEEVGGFLVKMEKKERLKGKRGREGAREGRECVVWKPCARARREAVHVSMTHSGGQSSTHLHSHTHTHHTQIYPYRECVQVRSKNRQVHTDNTHIIHLQKHSTTQYKKPVRYWKNIKSFEGPLQRAKSWVTCTGEGSQAGTGRVIKWVTLFLLAANTSVGLQHEIMSPGNQVDVPLTPITSLNIGADQGGPFTAMVGRKMLSATVKTVQEWFGKQDRVWGAPICSPVHGGSTSQLTGLTGADPKRSPAEVLWSTHLDRSEMFWRQRGDLCNIRQVVLMSWMMGVGQRLHYINNKNKLSASLMSNWYLCIFIDSHYQDVKNINLHENLGNYLF